MKTKIDAHKVASSLPECACRYPWDESNGTFFCSHPRVHIAGQQVTAANCRRCKHQTSSEPSNRRPYPALVATKRNGTCQFLGDLKRTEDCKTCRGEVKLKIFQCDHPEHDETNLRECRACVDYELRLSHQRVTEWAVGMTTAPRKVPTVERSIASLARAGWKHVMLFAEPGTEVPEKNQLTVTYRSSRLGGWGNWFLALSELYLRRPKADAFMVVQDDILLCNNLRPYLEAKLWPQDRAGVISIYRSSYYEANQQGFHSISTNHGLIGALALVFSNTAVRAFLTNKRVIAHCLQDAPASHRQIDTVIGNWCRLAAMPAFVHTPSLVQHIGDESAIWDAAENEGRRVAADFPGESFDCLSLLESG